MVFIVHKVVQFSGLAAQAVYVKKHDCDFYHSKIEK